MHYSTQRPPYQNELYHHGIKGQTWGVQNGPPYPLDRSIGGVRDTGKHFFGKKRYQNSDGSLTVLGYEKCFDKDGSFTNFGKKMFWKTKKTKYGISREESEFAQKYYTYQRAQYTNPDGTLNEKGKHIWESIYGSPPEKGTRDLIIEREAKSSGIDVNKNIIKKGSIMQRLAGEEKIDFRRKYVSILPEDNRTYESMMEMLPISGKPYKYNYKATKNIKVASGEKVAKYLLNKYGTKELINSYNVNKAVRAHSKINSEISKDQRLKWMSDYNKQADKMITQFFADCMKPNNSFTAGRLTVTEVQKYFSQKGYDAMIDIEDAGIAGYPLIIFAPKNALSLTNKTSLYGS